jgi:hypothetical protein
MPWFFWPVGKRADKIPSGSNRLPQFDVVRLLEAARNMLNTEGLAERIAESDLPSVCRARAVVESTLSAKQRPSTQRSEFAAQLRRAARELIVISDRNVQHAILAMMIAADMSDGPHATGRVVNDRVAGGFSKEPKNAHEPTRRSR